MPLGTTGPPWASATASAADASGASASSTEGVDEPNTESLTELELSILRFAADGMTNKEIALQIDGTEVAVKMHMRAICQKLNARNRTHAAIIARQLTLI
jgi:DNA-binding NarL/FixJ family response regulator